MVTTNQYWQNLSDHRTLPIALLVVPLALCAACSDVEIASIAATYVLDVEQSEQRTFRAKDVSLTLSSDGTCVLTGEFDGDDQSYEGEWSLNGNQIEFSGGSEFQSASATAGHERLFVVGLTMLGDQPREFVRDEWPAWISSIVGAAMLIFAWLMYANRDSPKVTFSGGSPEFVVWGITLFSVLAIIMGIVGSFKPEVVVWAGEASDLLSMIEYLGFLGLAVIGILGVASEEEGTTRLLWVLFGLGAVALLVWLYFRYGVEISVSGG